MLLDFKYQLNLNIRRWHRIENQCKIKNLAYPFYFIRWGTFTLMLKQVLALMTLPRSNSCMTFQTHFLYHQTMRRINPRFQFHKGLFGVAARAAKSWLGVIWKSIDYQAEEERIYHSNGTLGVSPNPMVCRKRNFQKILLPTLYQDRYKMYCTIYH